MDNLQIDARLEEMDKERLKIRRIVQCKKIVDILFAVMGISLVISFIIIFVLPMFFKDFAKNFSNIFFDILPYALPIMFILLFVFSMLHRTLYFINRKKIKNFENEYKTRILRPVLNRFFPGCSYFPNKEIESSHFRNLGFSSFDRYYSNDFISGMYNDINFCSADVKLIKESNDSTYRLFNGRWVILDLNLDFKDKIEIYPRKKKRAYRTNYIFKKEIVNKEYKTSNEKFNDEFAVFGASQEVIDRVLTPEFLNNLLNFSKTTDKNLIVILYQGSLNFGIDDREYLMELSYDRDNKEEISSLIMQTERRMSFITKFMNSMDLNNVLKNSNSIQ